MGFIEFLTLVLIVLKLVGVISISWLMVFTPMIVVYGAIVLIYVAMLIIGANKVRKEWEKW